MRVTTVSTQSCFIIIIGESNHTAGVDLTMPMGESCPHSDSEFYQLTLSVICDSDVTGEPEVTIDTDSIDTPCTPRALVRSSHGCPSLTVSPLFNWIHNNRYMLAPAAGILGVYLVIFGLYFSKITNYLYGNLGLPVISLGLIYGIFMPIDSDLWIVTVLAIVFLLIGISAGLTTKKYSLLAKILAGVFCGWPFFSQLFIHITHRINDYDGAWATFWIMYAIIALVFAIIVVAWFPRGYILATSFLGAYLIIRCLAVFAGGFTNEFVVIKERHEGRYDELAWQNYLYINLAMILGVIAFMVQHRLNNLDKYEKSDAPQSRGFDRV